MTDTNKKGVNILKLYEYRLVNIKVFKENDLIYEGKIEDLPEEYKECETKSVKLESGTVVATI